MVRSITRWSKFVSLVSLVALTACAAGCSDDDGAGAGDGGSDGITVDPFRDGTTGDDAEDGGPQVTTTFRFANVSPDLGAFDVCYRLATHTSWMGPIFVPTMLPDAGMPPPADAGSPDAIASDASTDASLADTAAPDASTSDAGPTSVGVLFATMSNYIAINGSGTFDIALVTGGETSCAHPRALGHITLDPGKHATVVVMGLVRADAGADSALAITAFTDDATLVSDSARTRFIHGALGGGNASTLGTVSIAALSGAGTTPLVGELRPGLASMASSVAPKIDALGYGNVTPIADSASLRTTQQADAGGQSTTTSTYDLRMTAASLHTAIVFDDTDGSVAILWCSDGGFGGPVTLCAVLPSR